MNGEQHDVFIRGSGSDWNGKKKKSEGGSWDFDIEVGIDNAAMPASVRVYPQATVM